MKKASSLILFTKDRQSIILQKRDRSEFIYFSGYWGLIGGAAEENETAEECMIRECLEETGCKVTIKTKICSAETFTYHDKIGYFHPVQTYYTGIINEKISEPIETDHELVWLDCNNIKNITGKINFL